MARPRKPIELSTGVIPLEEREKRENAELELVGDRDLLFTPPETLNDREKDIYLELLEPIKHIKTLCDADRTVLEILSNAKYMMEKCNEIIQEEGLLVAKINKFGEMEYRKNPAIDIYKQYENIFRLNAVQIGLSPSARTKLVQIKQEKEEQSELDNILGALRS